jgi:hypothetical protein
MFQEETMRSKKEIEEQINKAIPSIEKGRSDVPGMTYEEGVDNALRWALGDSDDAPIEDD